jgi:hypothetical protein
MQGAIRASRGDTIGFVDCCGAAREVGEAGGSSLVLPGGHVVRLYVRDMTVVSRGHNSKIKCTSESGRTDSVALKVIAVWNCAGGISGVSRYLLVVKRRTYQLMVKVDRQWIFVREIIATSQSTALRLAIACLKPEHYDKPIRVREVKPKR